MHFLQPLLVALPFLSSAAAYAPNDVFEKAQKWAFKPMLPKPAPQIQESGLEKRNSRWLTAKTKPFAVDGKNIPEVPFDVGESYSGLLPISDNANETRKLFFWFFPTENPAAGNELTFWFNGGPGCSSLSGLLTENGPFTWQAGTLAPVKNPYSWTNLTNMVWIEQPIGTGYTTGKPNIMNEVQLAQELLGFYKNFMKTFETQGYGIYVTGESYAGYYAPYISDAFVQAKDKDMPLKGMAINDPIIGDGTVQQQIPIVPFVDYWSNVFYLNQTFTKQLKEQNKKCGYTDYFNKYLQFPPPKAPFPVLNPPQECDIFDMAAGAITLVNPCFNIYHIMDTCPFRYSVLGIVNPGDYTPMGSQIYFNRTDVKKALHAPLDSNWLQCSGNTNVFGGPNNNQSAMDRSLGPAQNRVLPNVIEATNNVIIGSGNLDFLLSTNGTLMAIQNMTWNGVQGFQKFPGTELFVPYHPEYFQGSLAGAGELGQWGCERGLTFYQTQLAGHEVPEYAPGVGYRSLEILLGRVKDFSTKSDFSTQKGNFGN